MRGPALDGNERKYSGCRNEGVEAPNARAALSGGAPCAKTPSCNASHGVEPFIAQAKDVSSRGSS